MELLIEMYPLVLDRHQARFTFRSNGSVRMLQAESIRDKYTGGTQKTLVVKKDSIDE